MPDVSLNKQQLLATAMGTGTSQTQDVLVDGRDTITVQANLNGAANGDLTVVVTPYEEDGVTLATTVLTALRSAGPTFVTSKVTFWGTYNVEGFSKVQVKVTNNNAGTQTLNRLSTKLGPLDA